MITKTSEVEFEQHFSTHFMIKIQWASILNYSVRISLKWSQIQKIQI